MYNVYAIVYNRQPLVSNISGPREKYFLVMNFNMVYLTRVENIFTHSFGFGIIILIAVCVYLIKHYFNH